MVLTDGGLGAFVDFSIDESLFAVVSSWATSVEDNQLVLQISFLQAMCRFVKCAAKVELSARAGLREVDVAYSVKQTKRGTLDIMLEMRSQWRALLRVATTDEQLSCFQPASLAGQHHSSQLWTWRMLLAHCETLCNVHMSRCRQSLARLGERRRRT